MVESVYSALALSPYITQLQFVFKELIYDINKATPITDLRDPEGSGRLRLQITRHSAHEGCKVVTLTYRPPLPPGISWYSFLEPESNPGHTEMSAVTEEIPSVTAWNRSRVLPTCSVVPTPRPYDTNALDNYDLHYDM